LFISGHIKNALPARSIAEEGILFLKKPFKVQELAGKIREVLD